MRQRILIYGDSNVWGARFGGSRIPYSRRWANQVRRMLRRRVDIVVDGVCGRVAGSFRTDKPHKMDTIILLNVYMQHFPSTWWLLHSVRMICSNDFTEQPMIS